MPATASSSLGVGVTEAIADAIPRALDPAAHKTRLSTFRAIREQLARPLELHAVPAIEALINDGAP